ncbi:UDP-N-acetylmuramoyl-L-alanine--D-glutamate ligase [Candidatus Daviesbacteria bacterium]|nr:UDP-N-acetylmuramoyl-L-alanine--D-glutamate ligase [Candidatus Daviesbacteria bacterium]
MKVLIFGLGLNQGGVGSAIFFAKQKDHVRVTDLKDKIALKPSLNQLKNYAIEYTLGQHRYEDIDWADLIIKNPAVKPDNPYIQYALKKDKKVETDMGIFLQYVKPSQIIGVTGTKGKSTTASLIYKALKNAAHPGGVKLAGNIGKSVLEATPHIKPDSLVILELSSFQLEAFDNKKISPHWAVITNIYPDHLNYYKNMDEYIEAKKPIVKYQTKDDFLFMRKNDPFISKGKKIYFSVDDLPKNFSPKIKGEHNLENLAAALAIVKQLGIQKKEALKIMKNFMGIPFRLELIKTWRRVKIYNDSAATNPEATIQALKTLPNCILICGGVNKNLPYQDLAKAIKKYAKKVFFLEGTATEKIRQIKDKTYSDLEKLLQDIKSIVKPGDTILFSPAAASFNLFQNEFDRGRKFNAAVEKVFSD